MTGARARLRALAARLRNPRGVDRELVGIVADLLEPGRPSRVAVLVPSARSPLVAAVRRRCRSAEVDAIDLGKGASARHVLMTAHAPYDLVLDAAAGAQGRRTRFQDTFFHLRAGGVAVVAGAADEPGGRRTLRRLLRKGAARRGVPLPTRSKRVRLRVFDQTAVGDGVASVQRRSGHLLVTSSGLDARAKLREDEANAVIALRPDLGHRVVAEVPAEHFESRCVLTESTPERGPDQPTAYDAPAAYLREYRDVVVGPGQVVTQDGLLWPDTFRHNARPRIRSASTIEMAPRFARVRFDDADPDVLRGPFFHLDNEVRGHFGHLLTEQVSRLWAWPQAKALEPDLKVLVCTNRRPEVMPYEYAVYEAAGIAPEDVVLIDRPARVERLLSASPMLSNPDFVHPALQATWRRIGDHLAAQATDGPRPTRFFCSRRLAKRACNNTPEVEDLFRSAGFEIVFPEDHSLGDQVQMFRAAEVVAGFAGSGLFNMCFVERPLRVITIASEAYSARNEYLFASVLGHRIDAVYSVPDQPRSFQSTFTLDLDREGAFLKEVLRDLD